MTLHPKVIDLTLDRVWRLLERLDHPERKLPRVIHIAGTNGKGSTQAYIRAGLEAEGQKVHAYTSPHLARFHERIRLAGSLISEEHLTHTLDRCLEANGPEPITYFEITTVAALLAFSETPADYTLLEVGLGGRLDATNVIETPALTAITPVDLDHQQFLGTTLEEIASEKAGILKRGVPCLVGPQHEAARDVIAAKAMRMGAPLQIHGEDWHVSQEHERLIFQDETGLLDLPLPGLPGAHQIQNAGIALAALRSLGFKDGAFEGAMRNVSWPARMQRLKTGALAEAFPDFELWLDGGHNPAAGQAIAKTLDGLPSRPTTLICGMLNTKDIAGYLQPLARRADRLIALSIPGEAATLPAEATAQAATDLGLTSEPAKDLFDALNKAQAFGAQRVLICGSLYMAGHVLRENEKK